MAVLVLCLVCFADIESVDEYYMSHMEDITENSETVTITIRCDTILDNYDKLAKPLRSEQYVPSDGARLLSALPSVGPSTSLIHLSLLTTSSE